MIPLLVTEAPPSAVTLPPVDAVEPFIEDAAVVVTVGATEELVGVTDAQVVPTRTPSSTSVGAAVLDEWQTN